MGLRQWSICISKIINTVKENIKRNMIITLLINCFWVLVGVGITLYGIQRISKNESKITLKSLMKLDDLKNEIENIHKIKVPYTKTTKIIGEK